MIKNIRLIGFVVIILIVYSSFVVLDGVADKIISRIDGTEARKIESTRKCTEDIYQEYVAIKTGHISLAYPDLFSVEPYKNWANQFKIAPLGSIPNVNVYYCNEGYGTLTYKTDRLGFRNDDSLYESSKINGLLIGDSFAHGACVDGKQTISAQLNIQGDITLNLATGGNQPTHYAALAKTFIPKFKPSFVTIVFYPNDNIEDKIDDVYYKFFFKEENNYFDTQKYSSNSLIPSENLKAIYSKLFERMSNFANAHNKEIIEKENCSEVSEVKWQNYLTLRLKLSTIQSLVKMKFIEKSPLQKELTFGSMLALDTLKNYCETYKCSAEVVYIPNSLFWRPDYRAERYKELLKIYCKAKKIKFIDTTEVINKLGKSAYALKGPHLSPEGYKAVADAIIHARQ